MTFGRAFEDWIRTYLARSAYSKTFANLELDGTERVLELGCGGGQTARVLARRLPRGHLTAIDVDEWWADRARRNLRRYDNVDILLGDVRDLPLEDGSFDLAVVHLVIHDIAKEDRGPIIEALAGKLRGGGRHRGFAPQAAHPRVAPPHDDGVAGRAGGEGTGGQ